MVPSGNRTWKTAEQGVKKIQMLICILFFFLNFVQVCHSCCSYYKIYFKKWTPHNSSIRHPLYLAHGHRVRNSDRARLLCDGGTSAEKTHGLGLTRHPRTGILWVTSLPSLQLKLALAPWDLPMWLGFLEAGQAQGMWLSEDATREQPKCPGRDSWPFLP